MQGQEPLTASMLAAAPPQEQKQMLGEGSMRLQKWGVGRGLDSMRQDQVPNTNFLDCLAGVNRAKIKLPVIHSYILSFTPSFRLVSLFYWNLQC